jgi:hypothetical protein
MQKGNRNASIRSASFAAKSKVLKSRANFDKKVSDDNLDANCSTQLCSSH